MVRLGKLLSLGLILVGAAAPIGCRACGSPYDYSPPVASCGCEGCGRSGSAITPVYADAETGSAADDSISVASKPEAGAVR